MKMKTEKKWIIYREWCRNNGCDSKTCISNRKGICEDARGIEECKSHNEVREDKE